MTGQDKAELPEGESISEAEVARRFNETLGRLVNTPPKPHAENKLGRNKSGAKPGKAR
jgi:hypothetical protein